MRSPEQSLVHRDRKENGAYQGLGEGEMRKCCLLGLPFQFGKIKKVVEMGSGDGGKTM